MKKITIAHFLIFHSLSFVFLFSCENIESRNRIIVAVDTVLIDEKTVIDTFSTFPPEIDGCACYFSNNKKEFDNKQYIYADNYENKAFISINGILTQFILSKSDTLSHDHYIKTYSNTKGDVIVDIKQVGQLDETWQQVGTIKIRLKGVVEIVKRFHGECGC